MFNITPCAVSATRIIIAIFSRHILASLLHRTLNTEALHILIGRNFRIDVMTFNHQRQRHRQYKECHSRNCHHYNGYYTAHKYSIFTTKL